MGAGKSQPTVSEDKILLHGSHVQKEDPAADSPLSCCVPARPDGVEWVTVDPVLTKYFMADYDEGHVFDHEGEGYFFGYHKDIKAPAMLHMASGILVTEFAVDLREQEGPNSTVLFHYTSFRQAEGIVHVANSDDQVLDALRNSSVLVNGGGIMVLEKTPEQFVNKEKVLLTIYWPCCGNPTKGPGHPANLLESAGGPGSGPDDPRNAAVVDFVLNDVSIADKADCCIPILVERESVYDASDSLVPGISGKIDLDGWKNNGVKIIRLKNQGNGQVDLPPMSARSSASTCEKRFITMQKRVDHLETTLGPSSGEALLALGLLASNLRLAGHDAEAAALQRKWLQKSAIALGMDHKYTLIAMGNLAFTLRKMQRWTEAESLGRRRLQVTESAMGEVHPATLSAIRGLKRTIREQPGRGAEAEELKRREDRVVLELQRNPPANAAGEGLQVPDLDGFISPRASPRVIETAPRTPRGNNVRG